jgi:NAD(P)-dependent dehydrogenase (short-subunit alcohol dehydrogenase family)
MTKTWLITGSSRGFGRELAKAVLGSGDRVVATARRPEQLDDLVRQYGDLVRTAPLDVTDPVAAGVAVQLAIDEFGALDIVVNNANTLLPGGLPHAQPARTRRRTTRQRRNHAVGQCKGADARAAEGW